jgi:hypothetical protein
LIIQERDALLILRFIIININKYKHCHIILGHPTPKQTLKEKNNLLNPKDQSFQIPPYIIALSPVIQSKNRSLESRKLDPQKNKET